MTVAGGVAARRLEDGITPNVLSSTLGGGKAGVGHGWSGLTPAATFLLLSLFSNSAIPVEAEWS